VTDSGLQALRAQGEHISAWLAQLDEHRFAQPSALPGWDLRMLTAHVALVFEGSLLGLTTPTTAPAVSVAEYVSRYRRDVAQIVEATDRIAGDRSPRELVAAVRAAVAGLPVELPPHRRVIGARGPIAIRDWVHTRLVEAIVHSDDLTRSVPELPPVALEPAALAQAVRTLAEIFAARAPGRSVEVRVPPFVAVQAVEGPRHTRGTPPNVVEMDPLTWVRVAGGRVEFAAATADGRVRASGLRADLTPYLPVLG
jgi:uncharacterized protein (TIGR03083 family)